MQAINRLITTVRIIIKKERGTFVITREEQHTIIYHREHIVARASHHREHGTFSLCPL
jgi:hypothetical protein